MFAAFLLALRRPPRRRPAHRPPGFRPQLVRLEDRTVPSTFTVRNLNDSGPGSLRDAVADANPGGDTIAFADHLHGTIALTSGELLITDSVTINGPGAGRLAVSGGDTSRVFEIAAGQNVTVSGLTITHGRAPDRGGGILNDGSSLTLSGDELTQNVAFGAASDSHSGGRGGGVYSAAGTLTISGSGAVYAGLGAGGAVFNYLSGYNSSVYGPLNASVLTVTGCLIAANQAESQGGNAEGGGLANLLGASSTVTGSVLTLNSADGDRGGTGLGGGAYNDATSSLALTKCVVTLNRADGTPGVGGGVYTVGTFTDTDTLIAVNHAPTSGDDIGP